MAQEVSQKKVFAAGMLIGILVLCTIGFFILLPLVIGNRTKQPAQEAKSEGQKTQEEEQKQEAVDIKLRSIGSEDHIRGNAGASLSIITFTDMECPFCKKFHNTMLEVMKKYGNDVRWVMRHFPLDSLHQKARAEAIASECASDQGKFWEFVDIVFENTTSNDGLDLAKLPDYAKQAGVADVGKFNKCVEDKTFASKVAADQAEAENAGASGTPYSFFSAADGKFVPLNGAYPLESMEQIIQQAINK
jgi:protein-disulfide isomerase